MSLSTQSSHQLHDIFGAGYLHEQHSEIGHRKLPLSLIDEINTSRRCRCSTKSSNRSERCCRFDSPF